MSAGELTCAHCGRSLRRLADGRLAAPEWGTACWGNWEALGAGSDPPAHEPATRSPWRLDGTGVTDAGDIGGDIQAGPAWSVRYVRDDKPGSLITISYYATDYRGVYGDGPDPPEYGWQEQADYQVCSDPADPGGTELWSEVEYEDSEYAWETLEKAGRKARQMADEADCEDAAGAVGWDGEPFRR